MNTVVWVITSMFDEGGFILATPGDAANAVEEGVVVRLVLLDDYLRNQI